MYFGGTSEELLRHPPTCRRDADFGAVSLKHIGGDAEETRFARARDLYDLWA